MNPINNTPPVLSRSSPTHLRQKEGHRPLTTLSMRACAHGNPPLPVPLSLLPLVLSPRLLPLPEPPQILSILSPVLELRIGRVALTGHVFLGAVAPATAAAPAAGTAPSALSGVRLPLTLPSPCCSAAASSSSATLHAIPHDIT